MNNAIHGKSMEKVRNRIAVKPANKEKEYLKYTSKPNCMSHKTFDNNLVGRFKSKLALKLKKPAYTGMYILNLSRVLMYEFHYNYIKNKYDIKQKVLFTETDSLISEIKTEDVYEDVISNKKCLI